MRLKLMRRASVIHAVKCNNSLSFDLTQASSDELMRIKNLIEVAESEEAFTDIINQLNDWASEEPVASEGEIKQLLKK
ncbi:hypothetical protein C1T31_10140 [Hanstruepera neustonica]|uniref:Uncharacterized protein n=1 Tax=Hanstruepera neustonica TaxID=1445657 RepID=A0A2K1DXV4_9FLAO|nr:hypothetical protein [Hanstruepera neustonica]PNQ72855.1 hypothetical protein C1T31_10140 [Hanstruepera neustonica]